MLGRHKAGDASMHIQLACEEAARVHPHHVHREAETRFLSHAIDVVTQAMESWDKETAVFV